MAKKVFLIVFAAFAVFTVSRIPQKIIDKSYEVSYVFPKNITITNEVTASGTVTAPVEYELYLNSLAYIEKIHVTVGQQVGAGEKIFDVDTQKTKAIAENSGGSGEVLPNSGYNFSENELEAFFSLYESMGGNVSEITENYQKTETSAAQIPVEANIFSPINGTITGINIKENTLYPGSLPAMVIADLNNLTVVVDVKQNQVDKVKLGSMVKITFNTGSLQEYEGVVSKIYPTAQKTISGTTLESVVKVEVEITSAVGDLKPGYSVNAVIYGEESSVNLTLPYEAIRQNEQGTEYVYAITPEGIEQKSIVTGRQQLGYVEILSGIDYDDAVVFSPPENENLAAAFVIIKGEEIESGR